MTNEMNPLQKIITGLSVSQINEELGIRKDDAVPLDEAAMGRYMFERNKPIVFGPYSVTRNSRIKDKEDETKPTEPTS
ncbi:hypothetical protein MZM54_33125 [[Brevibacterium] frigoritolerans]|nr:hypothetical protein [Peribacillus frigoritolerans]